MVLPYMGLGSIHGVSLWALFLGKYLQLIRRQLAHL